MATSLHHSHTHMHTVFYRLSPPKLSNSYNSTSLIPRLFVWKRKWACMEMRLYLYHSCSLILPQPPFHCLPPAYMQTPFIPLFGHLYPKSGKSFHLGRVSINMCESTAACVCLLSISPDCQYSLSSDQVLLSSYLPSTPSRTCLITLVQHAWFLSLATCSLPELLHPE